MGSASRRRRAFLVALRLKLLLVARLKYVHDHQHDDREVERHLAHRFDGVVRDLQVRFMSAFAKKYKADEEEDEESQHFVFSVSLQKLSDVIGQEIHRRTGSQNRDSQYGHDARNRDGAENRIKGEDQVHHDDERDHLPDAFGRPLADLTELLDGDHVANLFESCVDDEDSANEEDDGAEGETALQNSRTRDGEEWLTERIKKRQDEEEQTDTQRDGHQDANSTYSGLVFLWCAFRLDGEVEQIVKAKDCLQKDQHCQVYGIFDGK